MRPRTRTLVIGAVVVVALSVGGVFGIKWWHRQQACEKNTSNAAAAPKTIGAGQRVLLIGDSWASGYTLPKASDGFPTDLAALKHWQIRLDAYPGTGWTNDGGCGGRVYGERLAADATGFDTVIVEGGLNDRSASNAAVTVATTRALQGIHAAHVVIVGPASVTEGSSSASTDAALRAAAKAAHDTYISTLQWHVPLGPDGLHPTVAGQRQFAIRLAAALRSGGL